MARATEIHTYLDTYMYLGTCTLLSPGAVFTLTPHMTQYVVLIPQQLALDMTVVLAAMRGLVPQYTQCFW